VVIGAEVVKVVGAGEVGAAVDLDPDIDNKSA